MSLLLILKSPEDEAPVETFGGKMHKGKLLEVERWLEIERQREEEELILLMTAWLA